MTFAEVEGLLADLHSIASDKRAAFQARLKNFLKLGYPNTVKSGRGKQGRFGSYEVMQMALAVELSQLGIPPNRTVQILLISDTAVALSIRLMGQFLDHGDLNKEKPTLLALQPAALSAFMDRDGRGNALCAELMLPTYPELVAEQITAGNSSRLSVINVSQVFVEVGMRIEEKDRRDFQTDLLAVAEAFSLRESVSTDAIISMLEENGIVDESLAEFLPDDFTKADGNADDPQA